MGEIVKTERSRCLDHCGQGFARDQGRLIAAIQGLRSRLAVGGFAAGLRGVHGGFGTGFFDVPRLKIRRFPNNQDSHKSL
ncbi:hypothetical protein LNN38_24685 [Pseudomonas sp. LA21]|uniref:hypothetical protein n=1 Tax=unclassified Pseudomonas TaxID=196821 RepID=UPI001FB78C30|nr:hypothetical protein [Pseudomonas sp. LA21]MCJ1888072.1 hypothetical protein [Pseudomonas sp. LA21]